MTVASGLECKELREALEQTLAIFRHKGSDEPSTKAWADAIKSMDNALSRDKSFYEIEAELMENVISAWGDIKGNRGNSWIDVADNMFTHGEVRKFLDSTKALDEFRAKK